VPQAAIVIAFDAIRLHCTRAIVHATNDLPGKGVEVLRVSDSSSMVAPGATARLLAFGESRAAASVLNEMWD